jgi:iron complex transport system ATP-binding protein
MAISTSILSCKNLTIGYSNISIVEGINLSANKGELIALMGLNGTGKTTFFKTILKEIPLISGDIKVLENSINKADLQQLVSVVYTDRVSIFGFTVRDMVAMGRMPHTNLFGTLNDVDKLVIQRNIDSLELNELADVEINSLSDGQFQKVMIARALTQETPIILLDEPTAFLDIKNKKMIHALLGKLAKDQNKTILVSTHNLDFCKEFCTKVWLIENRKMQAHQPEMISEANFI